ncbi:vitamin B6 photo-protection and homoeostasis-domain-containing protein [Scenedesmus sp. NREL 46B-D3]|nr:vitamin B6 photo-protection and homoeostasis-domain-containing protein [Scenedesmus sp. NREL 46B-D3]
MVLVIDQRFFSAVLQNFATQSLLMAVGVGARKALAASAAINWMLKDGMNRLVRMGVATQFGDSFDSDLKRFRFTTSLLYTACVSCEFLTPRFPSHFLLLTAVSNVGRAVGLTTFVSTQPAFQQALCASGNMADLASKTQHMVMDTLALAVSATANYVLRHQESRRMLLPLVAFPLCGVADLFCIYHELKAVQLRSLNRERAEMVAEHWLSQGRGLLGAYKGSKYLLALQPAQSIPWWNMQERCLGQYKSVQHIAPHPVLRWFKWLPDKQAGRLVTDAWALLYSNIWAVVAIYLAKDAAAFLLHRLAHRLTNHIAEGLFGIPVSTMGNPWWIVADAKFMEGNIGYQVLVGCFFLLCLPVNILFNTAAFSTAALAACLAVLPVFWAFPRLLGVQLSLPAAVLGGAQGSEALQRSRQLMEGFRSSYAWPYAWLIVAGRMLELVRELALVSMPVRWWTDVIEVPLVATAVFAAARVLLLRLQDLLPLAAYMQRTAQAAAGSAAQQPGSGKA